MANVIIGIHGLGNKPPKALLEQWWKLAMAEGLKSNNFKSALPKFELVYWADVMHDMPLNKFEKDITSPYYLDEKYLKATKDFPLENHETRRKIVDFLSRQMNSIFLNDDLSLNYSFITDAIISKYFKDLEIYYAENCIDENAQTSKAKTIIRERLLKVLEKYKHDDIMLISHSMGSIVTFDVLTFMATHINIHTFITMGSPLGLPIVISKIAAEQEQKFQKQSHMKTPSAVLKNWYNFSDILDKVAFNYKLANDFTENKHDVKPVDYLIINNYEINGIRNSHKSFGYLRTVEFSKILNEFILAEKLTIWQRISRAISKIVNLIKNQV